MRQKLRLEPKPPALALPASAHVQINPFRAQPWLIANMDPIKSMFLTHQNQTSPCRATKELEVNDNNFLNQSLSERAGAASSHPSRSNDPNEWPMDPDDSRFTLPPCSKEAPIVQTSPRRPNGGEQIRR